MKTTLELPDALLREAKIRAAREGTTLRAVVTRALSTELESAARAPCASWRKHFGGLARFRSETAKIKEMIEDVFER